MNRTVADLFPARRDILRLGGYGLLGAFADQALWPVSEALKADLFIALLRANVIGNVICFTRTKHRANRLADVLTHAGIPNAKIHGNRSQNQRTEALAGFKDGKVRVLVATDIVARGIDVEALEHVVNFDVPHMPEDYIHRVGRTARAEATGEAFTLVSPDEEGFIRELYLSTDQIVELRRRGHTIAGHSIGHPSLPQLDEEQQEGEVAGAAEWLEALLGEPLRWFNYPYGDHDERSEHVCERLGLEIAYSTRPPADWLSHDDRFRVPRVDTCFLPVTTDARPAVLAGEIL